MGDARRLAVIRAASLRRYTAYSSLWPAIDGHGFAAAFKNFFVASLVPCFWGWAARAAPVVFSVSLRSRSFLCRALPPLRFGHAPAARDAPATSLRSAPAWARLVFRFCLPHPFLFWLVVAALWPRRCASASLWVAFLFGFSRPTASRGGYAVRVATEARCGLPSVGLANLRGAVT